LCLGVVGPVLVLRAEGPIPALLVLLAVAMAGRIVRRYRAERDHESARRELSGAVSALTDECAAGAGLAAALAAAATVAGRYGQDFLAAAAQARSGEDVVAAWRARPELADVAAAYGLAARTGAPLASVLASVTNDLEADSALHSAVAAILAGPRSSAGLLAMLPVLGIALGFAMGAHPQRVLLHTRWGLADLVAGIAFDVAGVGWTMAIARRAER
jgi:tight adherence protein B